ncbi:MAG: class II fructose-bisphosphate aldolase [Clostridia bacterium]|nr:class II fructose-bisphosphate aldolase [Clostridia bacterium]
MSLVNAIDLVREAHQKDAAVFSFVCIDYNEVRAVINAAERTGKPAIAMLLPEYVTNFSLNGFGEFAAMVRAMAEQTDARIGLHLDHSYDEAEVLRAIDCGFTSVMFDASRDDLQTNIRRTRAMVEYAHARGVAVESELGAVGLAKERADARTDLFTKPETVALFCRETGVDSLAVAIGNAHGDYLQTPRLDLNRLDEIHAVTDTPLVLHGGSGIPDDQLAEAFRRGINKFNYGTDIKRRYLEALRAYLAQHEPPQSLDILGVPAAVQAAMTELIANKLALCRM